MLRVGVIGCALLITSIIASAHALLLWHAALEALTPSFWLLIPGLWLWSQAVFAPLSLYPLLWITWDHEQMELGASPPSWLPIAVLSSFNVLLGLGAYLLTYLLERNKS